MMTKKTTIILLCTLMLISLSSCAEEILELSTEDGAVLASNSLLHFYFYYPPDWMLDKNEAMISIYKDDTEAFQTDLEIKGEPYAIVSQSNISAMAFGVTSDVASVEDYWQDYCLAPTESLGNFTFTSVTDAAMGEFDAKRYDYTIEIGGVLYRFAQVLALDRGIIYTVTYTATPEKFPDYEEVLSKVADTFALK